MRGKARGAHTAKYHTPRCQSTTLWDVTKMVAHDERARKELAVVSTVCMLGVLALYVGAFVTVAGW